MRIGIENPRSVAVTATGQRVLSLFQVAFLQMTIESGRLRDSPGQAIRHILPEQPYEAGRVELSLHRMPPLVSKNRDRRIISVRTQVLTRRFHHSGQKR